MHVSVLYTFRSVSRAIPMVGGSGDPNKDALHMNTFKVSERHDDRPNTTREQSERSRVHTLGTAGIKCYPTVRREWTGGAGYIQ